jgi:hypothetical protein
MKPLTNSIYQSHESPDAFGGFVDWLDEVSDSVKVPTSIDVQHPVRLATIDIANVIVYHLHDQWRGVA